MFVDFLDSLEIGVCLRLNRLSRGTRVRRFFSIVSRLGDYPAWVAAGLVAAAILDGGQLAFIVQSLVTAGVGVLVYKALKERLVRERPYVSNGSIVLGEAPLDRYSFPSGHTLHAVSFTIFYGSHVPAMLWVLLPFTALVAASRVILGLHYPSDVIVGAVLGAALALQSIALFG